MSSDRHLHTRRKTEPSEPIGTYTIDQDFDFDVWAIAVRRQLLASLQKRSDRSF